MKPNLTSLVSSFWKHLYNANPLYLISACAVLYGLQQAVAADGVLEAGWMLTALICGYMLLLALACYVIVKWGQVWEDARSVLLVIVLVDLSLAISIDQITVVNYMRGLLLIIFGLVFSVLICEMLLAGLQMRLPARYRLPFYLILILNFVYPIWLAYCVGQETVASLARMRLGILLFPVFGAVCLLTLLPAARGRRDREPPPGTPWPWPWYPWTLFIASGVAIAFRSAALAYGFEQLEGDAIGWQSYLLIPLLLAGAAICLELGITSGHARTQILALFLPLTLLFLAFPGDDTNLPQRLLLNSLQSLGLSPIQLTLYSLVLFYGINFARGLPIAEAGLISSMIGLCFVSPRTVDLSTLTFFESWPLDLLAAAMILIGVARQTLWRTLVGVSLGLVSIALKDWGAIMPDQKPYFLVHGAFVCVLLLAIIINDRHALWLRKYAHLVIPSAAIAAAMLYAQIFAAIPYAVHQFYVACLTCLALVYWLRIPDIRLFYSSAICLATLCAMQGRHLYKMLELSRQHGLKWLALGLVALVLAIFISLTKGGLMDSMPAFLKKIHGLMRKTSG